MGVNLKEAVSIIAKDIKRNNYNLNNDNEALFYRILDVLDSVSIEREKIRSKKSQNLISTLFSPQTENFNPILSVNQEKLRAVLKDIAEMLFKQQNAFQAQYDSMVEMHKQSYDKLANDYSLAKKQLGDYQTQRKSIAEQCRYLMTKFGNDKDLARIFNIMGMTTVFPEEIEEEKISQYFTILQTDLPDTACISPCIMLGDEIFIPGEIIKYVEN